MAFLCSTTLWSTWGTAHSACGSGREVFTICYHLLQVMLGYAGRLTCASMQAAAGWYPEQQFVSMAQPGTLERFYDKREAADQLQPPSWHKPSPEEVCIS